MPNQVITPSTVPPRVRIDGSTDAPALPLSNPLGTMLDIWAPQMHALAPRFRVIRYDSRGRGGSAVPGGNYTIEALGRDAVGLVNQVGVERMHLCSVSKGGMVWQRLGT